MLFMRNDGSVAYSLTGSLPEGAIAITPDNIPIPLETSDNPGATNSRNPLEIEKSLEFMLNEKADIDPESLGSESHSICGPWPSGKK